MQKFRPASRRDEKDAESLRGQRVAGRRGRSAEARERETQKFSFRSKLGRKLEKDLLGQNRILFLAELIYF